MPREVTVNLPTFECSNQQQFWKFPNIIPFGVMRLTAGTTVIQYAIMLAVEDAKEFLFDDRGKKLRIPAVHRGGVAVAMGGPEGLRKSLNAATGQGPLAFN